MTDAIPFTNDLGEQVVRMSKTKQKVSSATYVRTRAPSRQVHTEAGLQGVG